MGCLICLYVLYYRWFSGLERHIEKGIGAGSVLLLKINSDELYFTTADG